MTRRGLFATLAAAIAAPQITPVAAPLAKTYTPVRYVMSTPVQYGMGFTVSKAALEADAFDMKKIIMKADAFRRAGLPWPGWIACLPPSRDV